MPTKLFISYAHEDEGDKEELEKRLKPYVRSKKIDSWNDRAILPGTEWDDEIKKQMNTADVIIFLVSPDFIASDYIYDVEIAKAIERYDNGDLIIVPIVIRPSDLSELKIKKFQALPRNAQAISTWNNEDEAWLNVIQGLKRIFDRGDEKEVVEGKPETPSSKVEKPKQNELSDETKSEVRQLIARAQIDKALELLIEKSVYLDAELQNQIVLLSGRYKRLTKDELRGTISNENAQTSRARINHALLSLLSE